MNNEALESYWQEFLSRLPVDSPYRNKTYIAEGWGDSPEMADELGALIAAGEKLTSDSFPVRWPRLAGSSARRCRSSASGSG